MKKRFLALALFITITTGVFTGFHSSAKTVEVGSSAPRAGRTDLVSIS